MSCRLSAVAVAARPAAENFQNGNPSCSPRLPFDKLTRAGLAHELLVLDDHLAAGKHRLDLARDLSSLVGVVGFRPWRSLRDQRPGIFKTGTLHAVLGF